MKYELSGQSNDASVLAFLLGGGEISDYPLGPSPEHVTGRVYGIQDGTVKYSFLRETLDWLESERLVKPITVSPPGGLTAEQMERSQDWEIWGYSVTEDGAKFLRSRQRNP